MKIALRFLLFKARRKFCHDKISTQFCFEFPSSAEITKQKKMKSMSHTFNVNWVDSNLMRKQICVVFIKMRVYITIFQL